MKEIINKLNNQVENLNLIIAGLEDESRLIYPQEYDRGASLLSQVVAELTKIKSRLSDSGELNWLFSLIRTLSLRG